jgi:hypothetical protein
MCGRPAAHGQKFPDVESLEEAEFLSSPLRVVTHEQKMGYFV